MSEFIVIQVGQCGNQIGDALWPAILDEYNVNPQNHPKTDSNSTCDEVQRSISSFFNISPCNQKTSSKFSDTHNNKIKARAVCIDMEDSVVSRFRTGTYRDLFDKRCFVTNYPGSGNNWAEGYCEHGPKYKQKILNAVNRAVEQCDALQGFLLLFSTGGGTGSGLGSYVLKLLSDYYEDIERFVTCVYATGTEDVITCPYNMLLATNQLLEHSTCVFPVENRALLEISSRQRRNSSYLDNNMSLFFKPFEDLNSIIVNMLLHLTSGSRFPGMLNFDMNELNTNMVPFPKMKFLSSGFQHVNVKPSLVKNGKVISKSLKEELFVASCDRKNQLLKVDPLGPKSVLLGATCIGRGQYTLTDLQDYTEKLQKKAKFTAWSKKSVKTGLCHVAPYNSQIGLFSLFNTSGMSELFEHVKGQFSKVYRKKAHLHHYTSIPNFDLDYFEQSSENFKSVIESYKEVENVKILNVPSRLRPICN